jgi:glutathione-regulated potassium-efflux system ancillary protein KefG
MTVKNRILILFAHPAFHRSRVNSALLEAIADLEGVMVHDLYEEYPDLHINVPREQRLLMDHDIIVWQHPFFWYSSPAILKKWQDLVLEYGFAYGHEGTALHGKKCLSVISTGGAKDAYGREGMNYFSMRELLAPVEQTARFCGMQYLPPFVIHGALGDRQQLAHQVDHYPQILTALVENRIQWEQLPQLEYLNEDISQVITPVENSSYAK